MLSYDTATLSAPFIFVFAVFTAQVVPVIQQIKTCGGWQSLLAGVPLMELVGMMPPAGPP